MRQKVRKALVIAAFLSFPITMNYLSPYVVISGAFQGIASGSFLFFGFLLVSSLFAGRAFCGWACPAAGIQECLLLARERRVKSGNWTKWAIWAPWVGLIGFGVVRAGGIGRVEPFHLTARGISIGEPRLFVIYYAVLGVVVLLSLAVGKRSFCHHLCWMAPFMVIGARVTRTLRLPSLRLRANADACIHCGRCTKACPMSLEVQAMVEKGNVFDDECILCGECVDACPKDAISFKVGAKR